MRFVGEARPEPYYGAADFVALPSYFDTFGLVILEGLACGLPVLTTAHAGGHEVITPGRDGFVIEDSSDSAALAEQIARLEDRQFLAVRLRGRARHGPASTRWSASTARSWRR